MQTATLPRKPRLAAIEYIRGISMMGVIGIHIGSQYIMNPAANIHLVALLETFTRFSVPIFFFISAFGLFYTKERGFNELRINLLILLYRSFAYLHFRENEDSVAIRLRS